MPVEAAGELAGAGRLSAKALPEDEGAAGGAGGGVDGRGAEDFVGAESAPIRDDEELELGLIEVFVAGFADGLGADGFVEDLGADADAKAAEERIPCAPCAKRNTDIASTSCAACVRRFCAAEALSSTSAAFC